MTFTAEQYLKENSFSEFDQELNGKSTCVEIETALAAVAMAREEIYKWLTSHYRDYMHNPTGEKLEAFFGMDMITDLRKAMNYE